jgi:hypothetical protein
MPSAYVDMLLNPILIHAFKPVTQFIGAPFIAREYGVEIRTSA